MSVKCPKCNAENPDTQSFCGDCGTNLGPLKEFPEVTKTIKTLSSQLKPGDSLANRYKVTGALGKGGMGEVYQAEDTSLKRQVAIKVLPLQHSLDEERLARFEREAKVLASLNHPKIAAIYGLEEDGEKRFLVMELVEGETLAERINRGSMSIEDSLEVCKQIAEAVEAAHEKTIIHRDLKPANIKITPEGRVKVLDFGLAKALAEEETVPNMSKSPTLTAQMTQPGVILGTAAYMSPEQAKGKEADKRTDIWALGCLLYECLTGKRAFEGETVSETIASILKDDPEWKKLSSSTPSHIQELLRRCLVKDPRNRLQHIGDARIILQQQKPSEILVFGDSKSRKKASAWSLPLTWILITPFLLAAVIYIWISITKKEPSSFPLSFTITLPSDQDFPEQYHSLTTPIALSPDGQTLVYTAERDYQLHLYRRNLNSFETVQILGTEGATSPFFSPDGQWIGFHAKGKLLKISISGGNPLTICELTAGTGHGATWGLPNTIIFSRHLGSGLWRVDGSRGEPEQITTPNFKDGEYSHMWPQILPSNSHVMFEVSGKGMSVLSLDTKSWTTPRLEARGAFYVPTGHILYRILHTETGGIAAQSYDLGRFTPIGQSVSILNGVHWEWRSVKMQFALSDTGTFAYVSQRLREQHLLIVTRNGDETEIDVLPNWAESPRFSPDGKKISLDSDRDILIYDLERGGIRSNLTSFKTNNILNKANHSCVWSLDGSHVLFSSNRDGSWSIYQKSADGTGEALPYLVDPERSDIPLSWSFDENELFFLELNPETGLDIWMLPKDGTERPLIKTRFKEEMATLSPDGQWLAYVSDETGQQEVYVLSYPQMGDKRTISTDGGREPVWSKDGEELFYRTGDRLMSVTAQNSQESPFSTPTEILRGDYVHGYYTNWDVSPDGERFVFFKRKGQEAAQINIILNWFDVLKQKVPHKK